MMFTFVAHPDIRTHPPIMMRASLPSTLIFLAMLTSCSDTGNNPLNAQSSGAGTNPANWVEGRDYTVLERVRFLDQQGFDRPVEAFSLLFPRGWKTEGGVQWGNWNGCRGEMVRNYVKASSPDGRMMLEAFPSRAFTWSDDAMMQQSMQMAAANGGCMVNAPFDAKQYIEGFARQDLGAQASNIRIDESRMPIHKALDEQSNNMSRQYGTDQSQSTTIATGDLSWPDGTEGIIYAGVTNIILRKPDYMSGGETTISSTAVIQSTLLRFPKGQRDEASKLLNMIITSHRVNPVWSNAYHKFMTEMSAIEHRGNMERIRLAGEQSKAYADAQSAASDQRMRNWENQQKADDRQHQAFVQTIREVETWQDGSGSVELSAGYNEAWSRPDGTYILSNDALFDPSVVFQEDWKRMQKR